MKTEYVIRGTGLSKKFKGFELSINDFRVPKGFATALIGENGAGKTTLLNMISGIRLDYKGEFLYFGDQNDIDKGNVKERIGYTGPGDFFLPHWTIQQVGEISKLLFDGFQEDKFNHICEELCIPVHNAKKVSKLSDGNRMKLMLATVLARTTDLLLLDEPASPLDPLMRDKLCDIIREYINKGQGEKSVFFSTHNIADMENVTDYAIIMEKGKIVEEGFVEELKEKYILIKGDTQDYVAASKVLIGSRQSKYGFEGLCKSEDLDKLAGLKIASEIPTLSQICINIMKEHTSLKLAQ